MPAAKSATLWVLSNRLDDRTVLWERDAAHPGGEAFVAGATPAYVGRTGAIEGLLRDGLLIEVPEPKDGPKKPLVGEVAAPEAQADVPGQAVRLGRTLDPDLFPTTPESVKKQQDEAGSAIPAPRAGT